MFVRYFVRPALAMALAEQMGGIAVKQIVEGGGGNEVKRVGRVAKRGRLVRAHNSYFLLWLGAGEGITSPASWRLQLATLSSCTR